MLELLAGPFPLLHEGDPVTISGSTVGYHDSVGLIANATVAAVVRGCVIALDGTVYPRNTEKLQGPISANLLTGGLTVSDTQEARTDFYEKMDLHALRGIGELDGETQLGSVSWAVLPDRFIRGNQRKVYYYDADASPSKLIEEFTLTPTPGEASGTGFISPSTRADRCFISFVDGRIFHYDHVQKALVGTLRRIDPCIVAHYSPRLGAFVAVHDESGVHVVRIWADEFAPATVSEPEVTSDVFPGMVAWFRAQVLGSYSEPCAGLNVEWTSTVGTVLDPVTATDASGWAVTRVMLATDEAAEELSVAAAVKV